MKNEKLQNIPLNLYFYSISDFQVIRNFPKKIKNLFPKKQYEKIQMNPAINKQEKKKKSQHFLGDQTETFRKKPNTIINEQNQQPKYLKYNILGIQNFLKKSRFSIQTNTKKITNQIKNPF